MTPLNSLPSWVQPKVKEMLEDLRERAAQAAEEHTEHMDFGDPGRSNHNEMPYRCNVAEAIRSIPLFPESAPEKEPLVCGDGVDHASISPSGRCPGCGWPAPEKAPGLATCKHGRYSATQFCGNCWGEAGHPAHLPPVAGEEKGHRCTIINCRERRLQGLRCLLACGCACHMRPAPSPPTAEDDLTHYMNAAGTLKHQVVKLEEERAALLACREALRGCLASAWPNASDHPTMVKAWEVGRAALAQADKAKP